MIKKTILALATALLFAAAAQAQPFLELPSVIGDGMVLQADDMATIWGWCDPNTEVTIQTSWGEKTVVKSDFSSLWKARVQTPKGSFEPQSITVTTRRKVSRTIKDVLIGQVWLCTGQSNMNWSAAHGIKDTDDILTNPSVRLFTVPKKASAWPLDDVKGRWSACEGEDSRWFSAVGLFFGAKLAAELGEPVGLVNASWGGTPVEVWGNRNTFLHDADAAASWKQSRYSSRQGWNLGTAFNGMIAPISNMAAAGAIWYQGEANRANADLYAKEFSMMISDWRAAFGRELPFCFVQIAPKEYGGGDVQGALVREQQEQVARTVSRAWMVNISDTVEDFKDIHPKHKRKVGERLAVCALAEVYGKQVPKHKSPSYASMEVKKNRIVVSFSDAEGGLVCVGDAIEGLEIGDGSSFYPAQGMIQGDKMVVWSNQVRKPAAVRYCFGLYKGNVTDTAGNPLLPFRSDSPFSTTPAVKNTAASAKAAPGLVQVSCAASEVRTLKEKANFFTNRPYPLADVPKSLEGLKFVAHEGISQQPHVVRITSPEGGVVRILARNNKRTVEALKGWTADPSLSLKYTTRDPSKPGIMNVWTRSFKKGESVTIEMTDFPGATVIAPEIELR